MPGPIKGMGNMPFFRLGEDEREDDDEVVDE
jgi:hypothetical protein